MDHSWYTEINEISRRTLQKMKSTDPESELHASLELNFRTYRIILQKKYKHCKKRLLLFSFTESSKRCKTDLG